MALLLGGWATAGCHHTFIELNPDAGHPDDGATTIVSPPPSCGNATVESGEGCDDGDRLSGDTCAWDCTPGPGDPVGPADSGARRHLPSGDPMVLEAPDQPPRADEGSSSGAGLAAVAIGGPFVLSWYRNPFEGDPSASVAARFMAPDGSPVRADVIMSMTSGWFVADLSATASGAEALLLWRSGSDGILRARLSPDAGIVGDVSLAVASPGARFPSAAPALDGYIVAWYEGPTLFPCVGSDTEPGRVLLRRLGPDGITTGMPEGVVLEEPAGAWTSPRLAAGDDETVGALWWRASHEAGGTCALRVGVAEADLGVVTDGGVIGPGTSGRIVHEGGAYRVLWQDLSAGRPRLGLASFDADAGLLDAPVVHDLDAGSFTGEAELAAGQHELVTVFGVYSDAAGVELMYMVTDLLGRLVLDPTPVDPTCTSTTTDCWPGPFNVVRSGEDFLVVYFATTDPASPAPVVEMRVMRLVPAG